MTKLKIIPLIVLGLLLVALQWMMIPTLESNNQQLTQTILQHEKKLAAQAHYETLASVVETHESALEKLTTPHDRMTAAHLIQTLGTNHHLGDLHFSFHPATRDDHDLSHSLVSLTMTATTDHSFYQMAADLEEQLGGILEPKEFVISQESPDLLSCLYTFDWITRDD